MTDPNQFLSIHIQPYPARRWDSENKMQRWLCGLRPPSLFIQAVLENITSFQRDQQILDSGPTIKIQNEWLYLSCPGRKLIALCD